MLLVGRLYAVLGTASMKVPPRRLGNAVKISANMAISGASMKVPA
jgi:hypothetical protein